MPAKPPPRMAVASLLTTGFVIAMGYGLLLPVLPELIVRLDPGATQREVLWHMGLVTAVYAGAALFIAPLWGRYSDKSPKPYLMVMSLTVSAAASIAAGYSDSVGALYVWRFVSGLGAGAAGPSIQVWFSRWEAGDRLWRTRRIVWSGLASTAGFFVGPFAGGLTAAVAAEIGLDAISGQRLPFLLAGVAMALAALAVLLFVPEAPQRTKPEPSSGTLGRRLTPWLLPVAVTALAISAFEVGLSSMAWGQHLGTMEIGLLFAQCTLFMFAAQSCLVLPGLRDRSMKPLIIPSLLLLATGLIATVYAFGTVSHVLATSLVAATGGLLPAALAREISMLDRGAVGAATGFQSAASQAGQTAGAVLSSLIAAFAEPQWALLAAAVAVVTTGILFFFAAVRESAQFSGNGV